MSDKPPCKTVLTWLRNVSDHPEWPGDHAAHGRDALAPMTGQDMAALAAFVHLVDLYGRSDDAGRRAALDAMTAVVRAPQLKVLHLFRESIAHILDWRDRAVLWGHIESSLADDAVRETKP